MNKKKCRICKKYATPEYKPFCSKRCADIDLGKWLNESYTVEGEELTAIQSEEVDEDI